MTSGNFQSYPISSVYVERTERQRRELTGIEELAESIHRLGLIHPIVIEDGGKLVAGERRLSACRMLGWTAIPVQLVEELSDYDLQSIELEENIKRQNLSWQDEVLALERFHKLKQQHEPEWSQEQTAAALGYSQPDVSKRLSVAAEMANETVATADRLSAAHNIVQRNAERKATSTFEQVGQVFAQAVSSDADNDGDGSAPVVHPEPVIPLLNADFHEWQESYNGPKFNLIHCDFPYGINVADTPRMDATIRDHYEDTPDIYWSLLSRLGNAMDNVVAESAHLIFWHSMKMNQHGETTQCLERMGWKCNPFPLIWHKSDGSGIAPDSQRGPRQTYEAAIFAVRGDRKITEAGCVANSFGHPGRRDGAIHISEKPQPVLRHFLRMICDEYSFVLDPTCGSANALKVAEELGAGRILGLEQSAEFYSVAVDNWSRREGPTI